MAAYYAVERSSDYLAHYGVKGMKWGVRRARERGNERALARHYRKATKKLNRLNAKTDLDYQKEKAKRHAIKAGISAGIGLGSLAVMREQDKELNKLYGSINTANAANSTSSASPPKKPRAREKKVVNGEASVHKWGPGLNSTTSYHDLIKREDNRVGNVHLLAGKYHPSMMSHIANANSAMISKKISQNLANELVKRARVADAANVVGVLGLGTAAYQAGKGVAAKYRTTKKGHAKAVAKRNAWKREMDTAFAGTRYASKKKRYR